jgi:carbon monoxide dehydrogenase subunit G
MAQGEAQIDIDRPAEAVWQIVRDFGGVGTWMPGIDRCTVEGDDRTLSLLGMEIVERNYGVDDTARTARYGIVGGALPVEHHRATITVTETASGAHVTWAFEVAPDNLGPVMSQTYQSALDALAVHMGAA